MPKFLSQEWLDAVVAGLKASDDFRDVDVTVQQVVTGVSGGEVRYWLRFEGGNVEGNLGDAPDRTDVTITQDVETAASLSCGELNAQSAFMQGKLKITGNMGKLLQHQAALQALGPVMSTVETEYEP